ncbi:hypothetical protein GCM10029978_051920 [Actinoallomurus acanthiterrae]
MSARTPSTAGRVGTAKRDRVRRHLLDLIENSGPGTGLPSERDLAEQLGVSRPTVRAAIEELTRTGLLTRQHGRGTFTSPHKVTQELSGSTNAFGVPPAEGQWTSRVTEFATAPAGVPRAGWRSTPTPRSCASPGSASWTAIPSPSSGWNCPPRWCPA